MTLSPSQASMTGAGMRPLYVQAAKLVPIPRLTFVSIRSRLNVFTDGPAHVAFWPFTASMFLVVSEEVSDIGPKTPPFVFCDVHAARLKQTQMIAPKIKFFISIPPGSSEE